MLKKEDVHTIMYMVDGVSVYEDHIPINRLREELWEIFSGDVNTDRWGYMVVRLDKIEKCFSVVLEDK